MNNQELREEFNEKFRHRFSEIAHWADKGLDEKYGHGLADLERDVESFFTSKFDERVRGMIESVDKLDKMTEVFHDRNDGDFFTNTYQDAKRDVLDILKANLNDK